MTTYTWDSIEREQLNPLAARQVIHTANFTVARLFLRKGAVVPSHHHINEQITMMQSGSLRFVVAGEEHILRAGEMLVVPPEAPHEVEALEDCVALDLFSPPRADWQRGDDAYLRR